DLGLSTARGRGRCKNPACDYMYKNRHKPAVCPKCGSELTRKNTKPSKFETLLDPYQELSPAQRDIQRQSTLLLIRSTLQIPEGLFNVGNRLLVSLDLFLKIRANIKLGQPPPQAARSVFEQIPSHPVHSLTPEESSQVQELFLSGYWAFECLTVRDYNDMICGICGVAPKVEIAQRHRHDALELKNVEVVCSSKYLVRGETARDHVDLLLSSRYWPPVYVCDCPRQVALCTDLQYPELATRMWGRNQGCFSDPFEKPEVSVYINIYSI
ncbi:hypothetical protein GOODEAATRI_011658, partial [Goodea atripinnis]